MHHKEIFDNWSDMLDLRSLTYAVTLARRANYARAADDLGISQPALTRAIQSLEQQLGIRLFDRDRSGVWPTPQGATFIERADVLVSNASDLERQTALAKIGASGSVRFGMAPMPARALLADALVSQIGQKAELTHDVIVRNVEALWPMLIAGEIEFFVSAEGQIPTSPPVRADGLGTFSQGLIVRAGHPLLYGPVPDREFPLLVSSKAGSRLPEGLSAPVRMPPQIIEHFETLVEVTVATDAIWICSPFALKNEIASGILQDLSAGRTPMQEMRIMMYSLDRRTQSPAARDLKDLFRTRIKRLAVLDDAN
jgi:DNA-binding transcriptional LysR family regulator